MPQFDFFCFSSQVFYTLIALFFFHFFILDALVISYAQILKLRKKLFNAFLNGTPQNSIKVRALYGAFILVSLRLFK